MTTRDDERLLQILLDRPDERANERRAAERGGEGEVLADLERFLARCSEMLRSDDAVDERRGLVQRVLDRTTREDLSWRGGLRLIRGYVAERLRSSVVLRVVAASLLLHLLALPVVGWILLREPDPVPHFTVHIVPRAEGAAEEALQELEPEDLGPVDPGAAAERAAMDATENALRVADYLLAVHRGPAVPAGHPGAGHPAREIALLALRSEYLHGAPWDERLDGAGERDEGVALALRVELYLDRLARDGERARPLATALARLESELRDAPAMPATPWRSGRDLMRAALDRAILYDVWPRPAGLDLEILAAARRDPLAQTWLDTLGAALGEELSADPLARAWLGWRR